MKKNCSNLLNISAVFTALFLLFICSGCIILNKNKKDLRPDIEYFKINPSTLQPGSKAILYWKADHADHVTISEFGDVSSQGSMEIYPAEEQTYEIHAQNVNGTTSRKFTVRMEQTQIQSFTPPKVKTTTSNPRIIYFRTNHSSITPGKRIVLQWYVINAEQTEISGLGHVSLKGSRNIAPNKKTTYILTAKNGSKTSTSEVTVNVMSTKLKLYKPKSVVKTNAIMPAPKQISPAYGSRFSHYPRNMTLRWQSVKGAKTYTVQVQYNNSREWKNFKIDKKLRNPLYKLSFIGAQPGRWRVWAINSKGESGYKSPWRNFSFTR
ncbi:MAG TPA: hypothetical protein QF753_08500 [Victivallales bacterium]|nr:hypothetical protein [Victivallales bacterium]